MGEENTILELDKLSCSYTQSSSDRVLYIENLKLQKGKIIFLLGASGSGKSTLLETLGLMNNTIAEGKVVLFSGADQKHDFAQLWKNSNYEEITRIRKNYLSFIFQNTNLMDSFTAYENICLSKMIKNNALQSSAIGGAVELMKQVGLPPHEVDFEKLSVNLSGGQRQRVSFVRALNTDFKLLLCDEPTGNLDEINAHELINIVKQNLTSEKTAILVSHDINLALKYADQIIVITKDTSKSHSEILVQNIFEKEHWNSLSLDALKKFREYLVSFFNSGAKKSNAADNELAANSANTDYRKLFLKKEGKVLFGKSKVNLFILTTIISITLLAIGFANGALHYLNEKLNDPFVNWITVGIPWAKSDASTVQDITDRLNQDEVRTKFLIDTITAYKETPLPFFNNTTGETEFIKGRLISTDDPIMKDLLGVANKKSGASSFSNDNDLGIVVTKEFMKRLRYPLDARLIYLDNGEMDSTQTPVQKFKVPIPVRAVINEIPGRNNYLITPFFYESFVNHDKNVFDFKEQGKRIIFFVEDNKEFAKTFKKEIEKLIPSFNLTEKEMIADKVSDEELENGREQNEEEVSDIKEKTRDTSLKDTLKDSLVALLQPTTRTLEVSVRSDDSCEIMSTDGYEVSVEFSAKPYDYKITENVCKKITNSEFYKKNSQKIFRVFDFAIAPEPESSAHNDFLCINFKKNGLDSIEAFSKYIFTNLNAENVKEETNVIVVDAGVVKEKKNFNYISKMTLLISFLLVVFSILAISLFISNLLKTHLNKVKMNLGTFKAFGLSDKESVSIYQQIMLRFIFTGIAISLVIAIGLGKIIEYFFSRWLNIEDQTEYFRLFDIQTFVLLAIILTVSVLVSQINIKKILSKTPGDLIYNR